MLFNSLEFILIFLPCVVLIYHTLRASFGMHAAQLGLLLASIYFYGHWDIRYIPLILGSILFNFYIAKLLFSKKSASTLIVGCLINLLLLAYYKYCNFFVDNVNLILDGQYFSIEQIILPIGISFFTFQQIAYLVDVKRGHCTTYSLPNYALFVCFFPQLIAGPIVHHNQMMPQFGRKIENWDSLFFTGLILFTIGLIKKVLIADNLALIATPIFSLADAGQDLEPAQAWLGILCYTFQLYFDFSGYTDMALGMACFFGIHLPSNFLSPYKSTSIIEFWKRWHITLSTFLKDYLYISLGGNRNGNLLKIRNLFITMLLGGIWHGAGWGFIVWGALHGIYLVINHQFRNMLSQLNWQSTYLLKPLFWLVSFICVCIAWVFFRASTLTGAINILEQAFNLSDLDYQSMTIAYTIGWQHWAPNTITDLLKISLSPWLKVFLALLFVVLTPNSHQIKKYIESVTTRANYRNRLELSLLAIAAGFGLAFSVLMISGAPSEFIYFQF